MESFQPWMDAPTPQNEASSHSFVEPLPMPLNGSVGEDSDEWEYEYSTTETETFYLTLDLTTPSIPTSRPRANPLPSGRASTKTKWINPGLGRHKRQLGHAPTISLGDKDKDKEGEDTVPVESADEEPQSPTNDTPRNDENEPESNGPAEQKIQILHLESDNPLISYRDHTFTCRWTKNIGSELLFTPDDDTDDPLPALRHLPGGVALLASCSARLTSATATVVPVTHATPLSLAPYEEGPLVESVSVAASTERRNQARFLERLMGIKERKAEDDEVTVVAYKRTKFHGWIEIIRKRIEDERATIREGLSGATPEEAEVARRRLAELDEQELRIPTDAPVDEDDDDEPAARPVRRKKKRKEMLTVTEEKGTTMRLKPRGVRRRPRRDWKRYNLDGTAAARNAEVNWQGVHTQEAGEASGAYDGTDQRGEVAE
ncbi:hypothetical protein VE01_04717 [Pseudogymnoascus verrucosus]|uniref:Transcription factor TFIIIC triple barrel domain-containing protein n=1 Tax=Pseudogymnoascus verrucosus TaxID=342668 RepID=A0A1B8GN35_9PEZI|nr:uncharacterized protein VE01_04717 [Pseudogymnoascus verrucosus]OBT97251.1 hypothetical protein VE01_04717 [Pseudogymnoascus verrucosus]